jgi:hypothetical protein
LPVLYGALAPAGRRTRVLMFLKYI